MSRAPGDPKRSTRESCLPGAGRIRRSRRHEDLGCPPVAPTDEDKTMTDAELDQLSVNTIRTLSIDAVERAKSGHPGTPMALAPLVYTIWNRVMRFDPAARSGRTAIGSCCPTVTPRCCSGRFSI